MPTVAVTTRKFLLRDKLVSNFPSIDFLFNETSKTVDLEFFELPKNKQIIGIIAGTEIYTPEILDLLKDLRTISRVGVGLDGLPIEDLENRTISFSNTPGAPTDSVAEFTVGQILFMVRLARRQNKPLIASAEYGIALGLSDLRIGILGAGKIGARVLQLLDMFRPAKLMWYDPKVTEPLSSIMTPSVRAQSAEDLISQCDVLSLHLPLNHSTKGVVNQSMLEILPHGAILINSARAGLIDEYSLLEKLESGKLAGAYLDVWEKNGPLLKNPRHQNLYLSDHQASSTLSSRIAMERMAIANLEKSLREVGEL